MKALLWKDYRTNRPLLVIGVVLLLTPYAVLIGFIWYSVGLTAATPTQWAESLLTAAQASLAFSQLTLLLLAGTIIAGERRDRSAEFLAYLPPSRPVVLTSKALLSAATVTVIWGLTLVIVGLVVPALDAELLAGTRREGLLEFLTIMATSGAALFGTAWLGSSMLESPTYSTAIGLLAVMLLPFLLNLCRLASGWPDDSAVFVQALHLLYIGCGIAAFIAGWTYYVRRVEP
jgi:ABC-type transport system involved in multi-copper enzyme maturation permease subunit